MVAARQPPQRPVPEARRWAAAALTTATPAIGPPAVTSSLETQPVPSWVAICHHLPSSLLPTIFWLAPPSNRPVIG